MAIHEIENNPGLTGQVRLIDNVTYAAVDGRPLKMAILEPWTQRFPLKYHPAPRPLIVFVQGSSWRVGKMGDGSTPEYPRWLPVPSLPGGR